MVKEFGRDNRTVTPPFSLWSRRLKYFDAVPLPDGRMLSLSGSVSVEKQDGKWIRSDVTVNELLENLFGLSNLQWRQIMNDCAGDEAAEGWRGKILNHRLPALI